MRRTHFVFPVNKGSTVKASKVAELIALGVVGNSVIYLMPLLVGAMVNYRGFTEQQAGLMASSDLLGYAIATFSAAFVIGRIENRHIALSGALLMIVANLCSMFVFEPRLFAAIRFVDGLGGGMLAAIATVALGQTDKPDRSYGLLFAGALLFATAGFWGLPMLIDRSGLNGTYWFFTLLGLVACPVAIRLRGTRTAHVSSITISKSAVWMMSTVLLASIMIFFAQQNAVWAYIERIGNSAGLTAEYIGFSLGVATLSGFAGAALVAWAGSRFGRVVPLVIATALQLLCLSALLGHFSAAAYIVATSVIAFAWNVVNPFQLGILADLDSTGKSLAFAAAVQGLGLAVGPAAAAAAIGGTSYSAMIWLAGGLTGISFLLMLPALAIIRRRASIGTLTAA
jgi:predicted MFS family arabinose efflux permease